MLLACLTYARLEGFRVFSSFEASFNHYISSTERIPLDQMNEAMYKKITLGTKSGNSAAKNSNSTSRLSLDKLINKDKRKSDSDAYNQTRELFKRLMTHLYSRQTFFQTMLAQRPNFLDDILNEIERGIDRIEEQTQKKFPAKDATSLSTIEFANLPELNYVFYLMMHGLPNPDKQKPIGDKSLNNDSQTTWIVETQSTVDSDEENGDIIASEEAISQPGYESLVDYITVKKADKVRVYLASRALLMAIYNNEDTVNSIIEKRKELYKRVRNNKDPKETLNATQEFQNSFSQLGDAQNFSAILDFSVSRSNPSTYE